MNSFSVFGLREELLKVQFNMSFQQLRDVLWKVKDKSKEVESKQMADRCHRIDKQNKY